MVECARCGANTAAAGDGTPAYCADCRARFADVAEHGVVVEADESGGGYVVRVTADDASAAGGTEPSQVDALARARVVGQRADLPVLVDDTDTGSRWLLDEYLVAHPSIRREVQHRTERVAKRNTGGLLDWLRKRL